jgi:hypothetical protein
MGNDSDSANWNNACVMWNCINLGLKNGSQNKNTEFNLAEFLIFIEVHAVFFFCFSKQFVLTFGKLVQVDF